LSCVLITVSSICIEYRAKKEKEKDKIQKAE